MLPRSVLFSVLLLVCVVGVLALPEALVLPLMWLAWTYVSASAVWEALGGEGVGLKGESGLKERHGCTMELCVVSCEEQNSSHFINRWCGTL